MKQIFYALIVFILAVPCASAQDWEQRFREEEVVAFVNVTVITDGEVIENAIVTVAGDRIFAIEDPHGERLLAPENAEVIELPISYSDLIGEIIPGTGWVDKINGTPFLTYFEEEILRKLPSNQNQNYTLIDGTGKFLVPGMAEMHGHIPSATSYDQNLKDTLFLYLASGVTTVRGMLGAPGQLQLQQDILDGEILGPTLYLGGPSFNGNSVSSPLQARRMVRDQVAEGWDFLKIHPGLTLAEYDAMADEAIKNDITWGGHVPEAVGLRRALEAGQVTIDHIDGYDVFVNGETTPLDESLLEIAVDLTLQSGAGVVPTEALWENLLGTHSAQQLAAMDELKYIPAATRAGYASRYDQRTGERLRRAEQNIENRRVILKALYDAGAVILLGSDAPQLYSVPGFSILREMETMAAAGIPPEGILQAGSANVGDFFADYDTFGRIAPGNRADLILLNANPLEDISNMRDIAGVMVHGIWLSREEIDATLAEIEARNAGASAF